MFSIDGDREDLSHQVSRMSINPQGRARSGRSMSTAGPRGMTMAGDPPPPPPPGPFTGKMYDETQQLPGLYRNPGHYADEGGRAERGMGMNGPRAGRAERGMYTGAPKSVGTSNQAYGGEDVCDDPIKYRQARIEDVVTVSRGGSLETNGPRGGRAMSTAGPRDAFAPREVRGARSISTAGPRDAFAPREVRGARAMSSAGPSTSPIRDSYARATNGPYARQATNGPLDPNMGGARGPTYQTIGSSEITRDY